MRLTTLLATFLLTTALALPAHAEPGKAQNEEGLKGAIGNVMDNIVNVFTGDDKDDIDGSKSGTQGRANAINQIDKNIEKHGGEHKGLENARRNVAKGGKGESVDLDGDKTLVEEIVEDIAEGAGEEVKKEANGTSSASKGKNGHKGKSKGRGRGYNN